MTVRERMIALSLMEKIEKNPAYAEQIGLRASMSCKDTSGANHSMRGEENCV